MSSIEIDDTQMELLLKDVVETLDADGNGEVDLKEFVEGSLKVQSKTLLMQHQWNNGKAIHIDCVSKSLN